MRRLIHALRAFRLFITYIGFTPALPWSNEDTLALHRFLETAAGAKLRILLTAEIAAMNERAAFSAEPFKCGIAVGYRALWAKFQQLSDVSPIGDEGSGAGGGDDAGYQFAP